MTAVLVDTHVLIWLLAGNPRLGAQSQVLIRQAAAGNELYVSAITPWEIAMLVSKGKLVLEQDVGEWIETALGQPGIRLMPLSPEIAVASTRLPGVIHGDPADRILVATARHLSALLVSADGLLLTYGAAGHVRTFAAEQ